MGSYTFKWEHDAEEASVTGTFDNWSKSVRLEKKNGIFQKTVELDDTADKIYYKFVIDHNWTVNSSCHEADRDGNVNNYLTRADLTRSSVGSSLSSPFINSVSPDASTVAMAGKKNKSKKGSAAKQQTSSTPPREPMATGSSSVREDVSPTRGGPLSSSPAKPTDTAATPTVGPGGFPSTPATEDDKSLGVNPMPAAAGAINPIRLAPGEKVPESMSSQGIDEHVKLDKDSYNRSDAIPGASLMSQLPPVSKNMIPESSLPMGTGQDAHINSFGPNATTVALAGAVPREGAVPDIVKKSQDKAGFAPEASAVPEEVREKSKLEKELQDKVEKAPITSEGFGSGPNKSDMAVGAGALAAGAAGAATLAATHHSSSGKTAAGVTQNTTLSAGDTGNNIGDIKQSAPQSSHSAVSTGKNTDDARTTGPTTELGETRDSAFGTHKTFKPAATSSTSHTLPTESDLAKNAKQTPIVDERAPSKTATQESRPFESHSEAQKPIGTSAFGAHASTSDVANAGNGEASEPRTYEPKSDVGHDTRAMAEDARVAEATAADTKSLEPAETKPIDSADPKPLESAGSKPLESAETKPLEFAETKPLESKAEGSSPEATKITEAQAAESGLEAPKGTEAGAKTTGGGVATNGSGTKAGEYTSSPAEATPEKKKNRLSTMFTKIKEKLSDKK